MPDQPRPPQLRAQVRNAGDRQQIKRAERVERERLNRFYAALRKTLQLPDARLVFEQLIADSGVGRDVFNAHGSINTFNQGRQAFGIELEAMLKVADLDAYVCMRTEAWERQRLLDTANDAAQTARAEDTDHEEMTT